MNRETLVILRKVHEVQCIRFSHRHGREPEIADQLKKHLEELGEFIKALDGKSDEDPLDEYWDCAFSFMATALNRSFTGIQFTDSRILAAFDRCLRKIAARANVEVP
jgi:hypothetical protein